jgi:hypothetical protein
MMEQAARDFEPALHASRELLDQTVPAIPRKAKISPRSTAKLTWSTAMTSPNLFVSWSVRMMLTRSSMRRARSADWRRRPFLFAEFVVLCASWMVR